MNCDEKRRVDSTIATISVALNEGTIKQLIDDPIDRILDRLQCSNVSPRTPAMIRKEIVQFVGKIYTDGLGYPWDVASNVSHVVSLLDHHYQGNYSDGFIAAILDAKESALGGLNLVLNRVADIIKTVEREKYLQAILTRLFDKYDWRFRLQFVSVLRNQFGDVFSEELRQCPSEQLANNIPELIMIHLDTINTLNSLF